LEAWTYLNSTPPTYEHAQWMNGELLETSLGSNLNTSYIRSSELLGKPAKEQVELILSVPGKYVAVTSDNYRFEYLLDRASVLEQVAIQK